jgi:hypothetical protein
MRSAGERDEKMMMLMRKALISSAMNVSLRIRHTSDFADTRVVLGRKREFLTLTAIGWRGQKKKLERMNEKCKWRARI